MLVGDPGFPKRWGAPNLNRERQPIIWPKFSQKLQENETNGTGGEGGGVMHIPHVSGKDFAQLKTTLRFLLGQHWRFRISQGNTNSKGRGVNLLFGQFFS